MPKETPRDSLPPQELRQALQALGEEGYRAFLAPLIPTVAPERMLGVRTPQLRALARAWRDTPQARSFLDELPHRWFDENQLHAFLLAEEREFDLCLARVEAFLPWVDNWATCDQLTPRVFARHRTALRPRLRQWLRARHEYTVRFAIRMLLVHFLDEDFHPRYLEWVARLGRKEYYVQMMQAWYFATALAKQWDATLPYLQPGRLQPWVRRKTIQKALESFRITPDQKAHLRALRGAADENSTQKNVRA